MPWDYEAPFWDFFRKGSQYTRKEIHMSRRVFNLAGSMGMCCRNQYGHMGEETGTPKKRFYHFSLTEASASR